MKKYLILPVVINIIVITVVFYIAYVKTYPILSGLLPTGTWYFQILNYLLVPVLIILLFIISLFVYSVAGPLIASPFLDTLSLKTEKTLGSSVKDLPIRFSLILEMISGIIKLLFLLVIINIIILFANLLPFGSFFYAVINIIIMAFFCGFQFYDFPLTRRGFHFNEKLKLCFRFKLSVIGTGLFFILLSMIPVVGFLSLIISTAGATIAFHEVIEPELVKDKT
jgi:CysZ protein